MADESVIADEISDLSRKFESINANNSNQNLHGRLENNERTPMVNINPVYRPNFKTEYIKRDEKLPAINLPEKILIAIDIVRENSCTQFEFGSGAKYMPLQMIKRVIEVFIRAKGTINRKHEYALMILNANSAEYLCDYTNNEKKLSAALNGLSDIPLTDGGTSYDLSPCFSEILSRLPVEIGVEHPTYVNRLILIYSRSNRVPIFSNRIHFDALIKQKYFFCDALFVHESPNEENECDKVYSALCQLDTKQNSWILEVGRNAAQLHTTMAKLLAHPLQRPQQNDAEYRLFLNESTEIQTNV